MSRRTRPAPCPSPPVTAASPEKCDLQTDGPLQEKPFIVIRVTSSRGTTGNPEHLSGVSVVPHKNSSVFSIFFYFPERW
ncbi:hypothetical protein NPIL_469851 [Nephila pilipes]|uniref:Uncharacterized protein n=1 Tax=Nephila pilipes TaxID=299642 RepID=A0A8X6NFL8_NEPPI|nr:hypothetical protein NPIL_469851 [Nephila pilipes]